jgi:ribonuclease HI
MCGIGRVLYLHEQHYVKFCGKLKNGTNNQAKLSVLQALLKLTLLNHITHLYVFGDSSFVNNWMKREQAVPDITL